MKLLVLLGLAAIALLLAACVLDAPTPQAATEAPTATPRPTVAATSGLTSTPAPRGDRTTKQYGQPPTMTVDVNAQYTAMIRTNRGLITVELLASQAPITVNNFVFLAQEGFYDGLIFHRVITNFMIQGGDPTGTGGGNPGYAFQDEIVAGLGFDRPGILAMANAGPNTNGSQFFITVAPTPHLNGNHTVFGRVVSGQEVVETISTVPTDRSDRPTNSVVIERIEISKAEG